MRVHIPASMRAGGADKICCRKCGKTWDFTDDLTSAFLGRRLADWEKHESRCKGRRGGQEGVGEVEEGE